MKDKILLKDLIIELKSVIEPWNHSESTKWQYNYSWKTLQEFFGRKGEPYFNERMAFEFISLWKSMYETSECEKWKYYLMRYTTQLLIKYWKDGSIEWFVNRECKYKLSNIDFIRVLNNYQAFIENDGKSKNTCTYYSNFTRYFLEFIENRKPDISCITQKDVVEFIVYINTRFSSSSIRTVLCALRSFFKYLVQENLIQSVVLLTIPASSLKKRAVMKILTVEDENKVLDVTNPNVPEGKRNKAIVLLAMRLGLRMSDILGLKFNNIDWKCNTISIVQHKTKSLLQLPLLNDVGNAIADYIVNGRPETDDSHIFIRHQAPYRRLTEAHDISSKLFDTAGINQVEGEKKGLHVYRHSLASKLLSNGTTLPAISSILGHADLESSQVYISTDAIGMKKCPITLKGIEPNMEVLG